MSTSCILYGQAHKSSNGTTLKYKEAHAKRSFNPKKVDGVCDQWCLHVVEWMMCENIVNCI